MNAVVHTQGTEVDAGVGIKDATITVKKAVDGTKPKRRGRGKVNRPPVSQLNVDVTVDSRVMAAAKQAMQPGQRLEIVDAETVRLVNR